MRDIVINSSSGRLEGRYYQSEEKGAPIALVLHPHPLHGGTMNNKVVYRIFQSFVRNNFSVLRFNFRGVGKSTGCFDHGVGELIDAATAMDWLEANRPEASSCWIAGFSFGAWIALQLLMRRPEASRFIVVAPPVQYDLSFLSPCPAPGLIVQGTNDTVVSEEKVYKFYEKLEKQRSDLEYQVIDKANHFFTEKLDDLDEVLDSYLQVNGAIDDQPRRVKKDRRKRQQSINEE